MLFQANEFVEFVTAAITNKHANTISNNIFFIYLLQNV